MKKSLCVAALTVLTSTTLFAENGIYAGVTLGQSKTDTNITVN